MRHKRSLVSFITTVVILSSCSKLMEGYEPQLMRLSDGLGGMQFQAMEGLVKKLNPQQEVALGKNIDIMRDGVMNVGKETTGIKLTLSGSAIDNHLMGNFRTKLVSFNYQPGQDMQTLDKATVQFYDEKGKWVAKCPTVLLKAQAGANPLADENPHAGVTIEIYGDTLKPGIGQLNLEVAPMDEAKKAGPVKITQDFKVTSERLPFENLLALPADFPLPQYPQSDMSSAARELNRPETRVTFDTGDPADKVTEYYKKELQTRGWKTESDLAEAAGIAGGDGTTIVANNGMQEVNIDIERHSWGSTEINFTVHPYVASQAPPSASQDSADAAAQDAAEGAIPGAADAATNTGGNNPPAEDMEASE